MPFGIAYLARPVFDPPSSYVVPLAFFVAPPSYVSAIPSFLVVVQAVFAARPSVVVVIPLKYVVVVVHSLSS